MCELDLRVWQVPNNIWENRSLCFPSPLTSHPFPPLAPPHIDPSQEAICFGHSNLSQQEAGSLVRLWNSNVKLGYWSVSSTTWSQVNPAPAEIQNTCCVLILALAVCTVVVSGLVQHSSGLLPEYTVKVHEGRQENEARRSAGRSQWLIGLVEGENILLMYFWYLLKEDMVWNYIVKVLNLIFLSFISTSRMKIFLLKDNSF